MLLTVKYRLAISLFLQSLMVCLSTQTQAQKPDFNFSHLQKGLSHVLAIHQDSFGFMWFGTKNGLCKYDGYTLTTYENNPSKTNSLKENWVTSIVEDSKGNLYVGTFGGGLNILHRRTNSFTAITTKKTEPHYLSSNIVLSLFYVDDEEILIGTADGFCILNSITGAITHIDTQKKGLTSGYISSVTSGQHGEYWLGTSLGLNLLLPGREKAMLFMSDQDKNPVENINIRTLHLDSFGSLWIGTGSHGLHRLDQDGDQFDLHAFPMDKGEGGTSGLAILSLFEDSQKRIWVGTEGGGLNLFNRDDQIFHHYENDSHDPQSISNYSIWSIAEDKAGNLWFGTFNKGITKIDPYFYKFSHLGFSADAGRHGLNNDIINTFYEDSRDNIWIGTDGGGLNIYHPKSNSYSHYVPSDRSDAISSFAVLDIEEYNDDEVWLATWAGGINITKGQAENLTFKTIFPAFNFFSLETDASGHVWAGSWGDGLFVLNKRGEAIDHFGVGLAKNRKLTNEHIRHVLKDSKGRIWVGTLIGLNLIEKSETDLWEVKHILKDAHDPKSISSNTVLFTFEDSKGQIWIGTEGGLNLFVEDDQSFVKIYKSDGLAGKWDQSHTGRSNWKPVGIYQPRVDSVSTRDQSVQEL